ncbi:MAG: hypothetical protein IJH99_05800 [Eubacterium sp.]|nr:hypothetical protein [Eubacterium sp.]
MKKYERVPYGTPGAKSYAVKSFFSQQTNYVPKIDYPISIRENFMRAAKRQNPYWVPNDGVDMDMYMLSQVTGCGEADFGAPNDHNFTDWFGCEWRFVRSAGGPMLDPNTPPVVDDITEWEKQVTFPNLGDYDIAGLCGEIMKVHDPEKLIHVDILAGCTERLVALLGGYTESMLAMAVEPEAVKDFLEAFVDFEIHFHDTLLKYLPVDMITYHDDWGTERDTFFSPQMMEDIVLEPTKRLFDYYHSRNTVVQLHSCGKIERFLPYMVEMGADFGQFQARANDLPRYKREWGDKIGFNMSAMSPSDKPEDIKAAVHEIIDTYGKGGGLHGGAYGPGPAATWDAAYEWYCYSSEKYDEERGE